MNFHPTLIAACGGVPSTNWGCCSVSSPCGIGEGDCDSHLDCQGNLICGENNCLNNHSSGSSHWDSSSDCCFGKYFDVNVFNSYIIGT